MLSPTEMARLRVASQFVSEGAIKRYLRDPAAVRSATRHRIEAGLRALGLLTNAQTEVR